MIDVRAVLAALPHFDRFRSVAELNALSERLRADPRFSVEVIGASPNGVPIYDIACGTGTVTALVVGFPHCKEPICSLTIAGLLHLLEHDAIDLVATGVEWHIIPCIDPDGALLNEGWSLEPVDMERYMRSFYVQPLTSQVDGSFPIDHKRLRWDQPSPEAQILKDLLDRLRPDFYYSLHNAWVGGAFYYFNRDMGPDCRDSLYALLDDEAFPLQRRPMWQGICEQYGEGIMETWSVRKHYDYLEPRMDAPERVFPFGNQSWDYLEQIKPEAVSMATELGYVLHPLDGSERDTGENLRRFKLRIDADSKYLASLLIEVWERVKDDVDQNNPIYAAVIGGGVIPTRENLNLGGRPMAMHPTEDLLFNSLYDRPMKEADRFQACMVEGGFWFLCHSYQLVRLLKASEQTPAIVQAIPRLEAAFDEALAGIAAHVDFDAFEAIPYDRLARVQLGSGLVALNAILEERSSDGG
ncbi:hypothetical protein [Rhizorhabdus dicambivorans]|uniref:hypothetical protein n=1 Tax=Rhizorhabdus dicambivorans TaxID=1850238 RepID=UPI00082DB89E|nr:hypothetical protein [Rhizorhabdus dicambivorans]